MVVQRPLVVISGDFSELPPGDTAASISVGTLTAGSGIYGGGDLSTPTSIGVELAPNPSGLIIVGTGDSSKLSDDGVAERLADEALASGNAGLVSADRAFSLSDSSVEESEAAIASGTAAIELVQNLPAGTVLTYTAGSAVVSGSPVGLNQAHLVEPVRKALDIYKMEGSSVDNFFPFASGFTYSSTNDTPPMIYMPNDDRFIIAYKDGLAGDRYYARCGEIVDGNRIDFGPEIQISSQTSVTYTAGTYHEAQDSAVFIYRANSNYPRATAIQVDSAASNTLTKGTERVVGSYVLGGACRMSYDRVAQKALYSTYEGTTQYRRYGYVDVNGTALTSGYERTVDYNTQASYGDFNCDYSGNILTLTYRNNDANFYATALTVSGGVIIPVTRSFNLQPQVLDPFNSSVGGQLVYHPNTDQFVFIYNPANNQTYATPIEISGAELIIHSGSLFYREGFDTMYGNSRPTYNSKLDVFNFAGQQGGSGLYQSFTVDSEHNVYVSPQALPISSGWTPSGEDVDLAHPSLLYCSGSDRTIIGGFYANTATYRFESGYCALMQQTSETYLPVNEYRTNNYIGVSQQTVASGDQVAVRLPGSRDATNTGLSAGSVYYLDPTNSGFTTDSDEPTRWSGAWNSVGTSLNSTTILLNNQL